MKTITARQLNYMVFRYLQESGFQHAAFVFRYEAGVDKEPVDASSVPPRSLITCVQKGIENLKMKANLETGVAEQFDLLTMNANELKHVLEEKRKLRAEKELENLSKGKEIETVVKDKQNEKTPDNINSKLKETVTVGAPWTASWGPQYRCIALVFDCAWSPAGLVLASGSGDSTARIWRIADRTNSSSLINRVSSMCILQHVNPDEEDNGITTLDWNLDGSLLATGSRDGLARIWDSNGEFKCPLVKHEGPIQSLCWSKKNNYLLTGGCDGRAIVWDVNTFKLKQQFEFHSGPVMELDWRTNHTFASGAADKRIYVCKIGESQPVKLFSGHKDEVHCVKWDPSCLLLASCSNDNTVKIWSLEQDMPIHDFKDHEKGICTVRWSPTGPTTDNPNKQLLLATGSFDSTVKLWDVQTGGLYRSLNGHRSTLTSLSFSPNGDYLASGSYDKRVYIWSVKDGKILKSFIGDGSISQVSWNKEGNKIAYTTHKNSVCVSDFRM